MTPRPSQIRAYRILSCLAILHSAAVLSTPLHSRLWQGLAASLPLWLVVLALHRGRSIRRFLIPTFIASAFFLLSIDGFGEAVIQGFANQFIVAHNLEKLLRSKPRIILYSIDADGIRNLEVKKGYRRLGVDEVVLPDDIFANHSEFERVDEVKGILIKAGETINSTTDKGALTYYGAGWQVLRKDTSSTDQSQTEEPTPTPIDFENEPYKAPTVLGFAEITDPAEQQALITALARSARSSFGGMSCFEPRHGLFIKTDTSTLDLLICFECEKVLATGSDNYEAGFSINHAPESVFNDSLKRRGIPISQRPDLSIPAHTIDEK